MTKAVWDIKANFDAAEKDAYFDCLVAEFLLSYGKSHLTEEGVLKEYGVDSLNQLALKQEEKLATLPKLQALFSEVEMPLVGMLSQMERNGILLDTSRLQIVGEEISTAIVACEKEIKEEVGFEINLNSAIQVGNYLAEKQGVPLAKTKTGRYATNEQELVQYADMYPIIEKLLTYRELSKLRSTYVESLISKVDETGRVHTTYHQTAVNTGRLASTNPNMQNIPVTSEFGLKIKSCFVAPEGKTLVSFDYSQQELRILAHLSGEETLIDAYRTDRDVHKITASQIFKVDYDAVTKQQRSSAKTVNFGILYGMSSYGLSNGLHIPVEEAQVFIERFYETYPKIKQYYDSYLKQGKADGYIETILGRRRNIFDFPGQKFIDNNQRRVLINYPIQGSAADLMKKAMVAVDREILQKQAEVKLLLQIHDDLVFEVPDTESFLREFLPQVKHLLCSVYELSVPIEVEAKVGKRWGDMIPVSF